MSEPRMCFAVFVDQFNEHGYIPSAIVEGEAGHHPLVGKGEHAQPWYWGTDYAQAQAITASANADLGLSPDDVSTIIASSMVAESRVAERLEELGLGAHHDTVNKVQEKLIRDGVIT